MHCFYIYIPSYYSSFFILHFSFFWASRFAQKKQPLRTFGAAGCFFCVSRRAIRSITRPRASHVGGWFRYYPSRKNAFIKILHIWWGRCALVSTR